MSKNKHMNPDERIDIEIALSSGKSFSAAAKEIGKDVSTVSKEVKKHFQVERTGAAGKGCNDCVLALAHKCTIDHPCESCPYSVGRKCVNCGKCNECCFSYIKYTCPKLEKPPYVCNGCPDRRQCTLEKHVYRARIAQAEYEQLRSDSRMGIDLTEEEAARIDSVFSPLIKQGQSIHHIAINHPDLMPCSERTMYKYVGAGVFSARNIDLVRVVKMRPRKKKAKKYDKVDSGCRLGRSYSEYLTFINEHPDWNIRELDSVEGIKGGAVLVTIEFKETGLQLAYRREANNAQSVIDVFDWLYNEMGPDLFSFVFPIILADNGSEFTNPEAVEFNNEGIRRTFVFYCEPNAPYEKPHCERNHEMIRRCIPKGRDIGKYTQQQISLMMSHINCYARPSLGNRSPYDIFAEMYSEDLLHLFGLRRIPADEITLTPAVFKLR